MSAPSRKLRIATRESRLAMRQAEMVSAALAARHPELEIEIVGMTTRGDRVLDRPLAQVGGKGLFVKELEVALDEGRADIAVHSPAGARVGTSSLRRECQLRSRYPRLNFGALRGNVNTRLAKLDAGDYDAIILAVAGLNRLGLSERVRAVLAPALALPAIAQGILAIEFPAARADVAALLVAFEHAPTACAARAERSLGRVVEGSCEVPVGALARIDGDALALEAFIGMPDGTRIVRDGALGRSADAAAIGSSLGEKLLAAGGREILRDLARRTA